MDAKSLFAPVTHLFGSKKKKDDGPQAPEPDDKKSRVKKERDAALKYGNKGRVGTILDKDTLG